MNQLPRPRTRDIVVQFLGKEVLIYDLKTHKAYNLNETSTRVYEACGNKLTFDKLKKQYKYTDDLIYLALDELKSNDLIENYQNNHFTGISRREAIRKVGLATMVALPVITAIIAPTAAMAQSRTCTAGGQPTPNPSTQVAVLKAQCCSGCYRDFIPGPNIGTCCTTCGEARCQ